MREIINHIKKRGFKDIFNWKKLLVFFKSKKELCTGINIEPSEALAYSEQLVYRSLLCSQCVKEGICVGQNGNGCGCSTEGLMTTTSGVCGNKDEDGEDDPLWIQMELEENWRVIKNNQVGFNFDIVSNNKNKG